jgi:glycerophosphoryl diester phosphodiesterase
MPPMAWLHAHRGASADAPENTMAAFRLGLEQGADGIELDVQLSLDGVPIVVHDPTLDRTTDGLGPVAGTPAKAIAQLDTFEGWARLREAHGEGSLRRWTPDETRVPTLESVLAWLPLDRGLVIDVKNADALGAIVRLLLARATAAATVRLISFLPNAINAARDVAPWLSTGLLLDEGEDLSSGIDFAVARGHTSVVPFDPDLGSGEQARATVDAAAKRGISIGCYVVNDGSRARLLSRAGVAFLMSDRPGRLVEERVRDLSMNTVNGVATE